MDTANSQTGDTGATPTAGSIDEAAERLRARREAQSQPPNTKGANGDEEPNADDVTGEGSTEADDGDASEQDSTGDEPDTEEGEEGEGDAAPDEGDADEGDASDADDTRLSLKTMKPEELDRKVRIQVDGEVIETTMREALRGHMRQEAFKNKTAELSQVRSAYLERRDNYEQVLPVLESIVEQHLGNRSEAEWSALKEEDLTAYLAEREEYNTRKGQLEALRSERLRVAQEKGEEVARQHVERLQTEQVKFCQAFGIQPTDVAAQRALSTKFVSYLKNSMGFADSDIAQIFDHRAFKIVDKAMKYDAAQAALKKAKGKVAPPPTKVPLKPSGGVATTSKKTTGAQIAVKKAETNLKKTGSLDAAAAALRARREAASKRR